MAHEIHGYKFVGFSLWLTLPAKHGAVAGEHGFSGDSLPLCLVSSKNGRSPQLNLPTLGTQRGGFVLTKVGGIASVQSHTGVPLAVGVLKRSKWIERKKAPKRKIQHGFGPGPREGLSTGSVVVVDGTAQNNGRSTTATGRAAPTATKTSAQLLGGGVDDHKS